MKIFNKRPLIDLSIREEFPFIDIFNPNSRQSTDAYLSNKTLFRQHLTEVKNKLPRSFGLSDEYLDWIRGQAQAMLYNQEFCKHSSDIIA